MHLNRTTYTLLATTAAGLGLFLAACWETGLGPSDEGGRRIQPALASGNSGKTPKELWVTSQGGNVIYIRDFKNLSPIDQINLPRATPSGAGPHIVTFHTPDFAYVAGMTDGTVYVIDANTREIVHSSKLAPTLVHQVKVSPNGATALVSVISTRTVVKMAVDEANRIWSVGPSLDLGAATGKAPICTVFRVDSERAFVSLNPSGIAVVDVPTMTYLSEIPTDGFVACGMIKQDADRVVIASTGGGGHIYTLDMPTETMTDRGTLGAASWHSFVMTPDGTRGFGSSPFSDEVIVIDLTTTPVTNLGSILFDQVPGRGNNQPDAFGGGEAIYSNRLMVGLRAAGSVASVHARNLKLRSIVNLEPPTPFNPMTCGPVGPPTGPGGCAVHGVTARPRL
jgi:DNA-binding beta-propeller fold protein YncE